MSITVIDFIKRHISVDGDSVSSIREGLTEAEIEETLLELKSEEVRLESLLTENTDNEADLEEITNQLCEIGDQIDALTSDNAICSNQERGNPASKTSGEEIATIIANWVTMTPPSHNFDTSVTRNSKFSSLASPN